MARAGAGNAPRTVSRLDRSRYAPSYGPPIPIDRPQGGDTLMVWTKLSDDFADQCASLSDAAFRTHVEALIWTMRRETDGVITTRELAKLAESPDWMAAADELAAAGFWVACDNGYLIVHHMEHQPESEVIVRRRELTAERVRKLRRRRAGLDQPSNAVTPRVTGSVTERVTRDGSGRVGSGKPPNQGLEEKEETSTVHEEPESAAVAPVVPLPARGSAAGQCSDCGRSSPFSLVAGRCRRCALG